MADFLKLGDIKGEFASKAVIHSDYLPEKAVAQPESLIIPTEGDDIVIDGLDRMANAYVDEDVDGFMKLGDIKGEFAGAHGSSTSGFRECSALFTTGGGGDSLNSWRDVRDHNHGKFADALTNAAPEGFDPGPIGSADGINRSMGLVYWEQDAGTFDEHFNPGRGGDAITGEGRQMNVWTNGSATSFEDRMPLDFDSNDVQFGMRENIGTNSAPVGSSFMTDSFEPAAGMNSFVESLNPVLEIGGNAGPGGSTHMSGKFSENSGQMISPLSGGDGCAF